MYEIFTKQESGVGEWVVERAGGFWFPGRATTVGLKLRGQLIAGILYEDFNGANISMHVAAEPKAHWLTRSFLYAAFSYPFLQLSCKRVTAIVAESNLDCRRLLLHLGYTVECRFKDAHPDGDLLAFVMFKEDCKWLRFKTF